MWKGMGIIDPVKFSLGAKDPKSAIYLFGSDILTCSSFIVLYRILTLWGFGSREEPCIICCLASFKIQGDIKYHL